MDHTIYYKIHDGVCFVTCTEASYQKKMAFSFIDEIITGFQEELKKSFGASEAIDYRSKIETIERPYFFIKFERYIKKIRQSYLNPSLDMLELNKELEDVKHIVKQNIESILERESTLVEMEGMATNLRDNSKMFEGKAKHLKWSMWLRKNAIFIVIFVIVLVVIYFYFLYSVLLCILRLFI